MEVFNQLGGLRFAVFGPALLRQSKDRWKNPAFLDDLGVDGVGFFFSLFALFALML